MFIASVYSQIKESITPTTPTVSKNWLKYLFGLQLKIFKPREFYILHRDFRSSIHESTIMLRVCLRFCVFFLALSLPVYQNAHVICENVYSSRCVFYFQCFTVKVYSYKYLLKGLHALVLSLSRINKDQLSPVALRCVTFFSRTSGPPSTINCWFSLSRH